MCVSVYLTLGLLMWMFTDMAAESAKRWERSRGFVQLLSLCVVMALWVMLHFLYTSQLTQATGMLCQKRKSEFSLVFLASLTNQTVKLFLALPVGPYLAISVD